MLPDNKKVRRCMCVCPHLCTSYSLILLVLRPRTYSWSGSWSLILTSRYGAHLCQCERTANTGTQLREQKGSMEEVLVRPSRMSCSPALTKDCKYVRT